MATRLGERDRPAPGTAAPGTPVEACDDCFGNGWKVIRDGKGAGTAVRCHCHGRLRTEARLEGAGIPERYRACTLANFSTVTADPRHGQLLLRAKTISQRYVDSFFDTAKNRFRRGGLLFIGEPGVGKTHLAAAVLKDVIQKYGARGKFVDFTNLLHEIQSTFDHGSTDTKASILEPVIQAEILVLDELGAQKPTEWVMDNLYLIMNSRYTAGRPTIFTTNYRLEGGGPRPKTVEASPSGALRSPVTVEMLSSRLRAPLVSRLYEMAQPIELTGPDYRSTVKMHEHQIGG
ncbi:MAG: ATP-binding protein [Acidobacteriota bacterium]